MVINALKKSFKVVKPQMLNLDPECQFTSQQYIDSVKQNEIPQSMDGKSRWADNIKIWQRFHSFKYEEAYQSAITSRKPEPLLGDISTLITLNTSLCT